MHLTTHMILHINQISVPANTNGQRGFPLTFFKLQLPVSLHYLCRHHALNLCMREREREMVTALKDPTNTGIVLKEIKALGQTKQL